MAVYYKFKSAKDYDSIPIDGHFISVANLKEKIFESKHLGRGTDFDLMVANAQTNEEYLDEDMLIPKNTSVLVRRIPGRPRMPIVTERQEAKIIDNKEDDVQSGKSGLPLAEASVMRFSEETEWDEFGTDLYAIPEVLQVQSSNTAQDAPPTDRADEDSKIKALIDTPALDWQRQPQEAFGTGRGFGRGMGGRMMGARGFGRGVYERKTPPTGYICHRCKTPGHFIQHCPTNGDPNYDIRKVKPPTGIPKSMLMATPDGSYALPSGAVAVLKPNEAAFEKEIEGLPSTRLVSDIPPDLRCPLCKEVMKDAVLTSKCCFKSFCDKCIRDRIISRSMCVCGATNILADDLLPNKTLRDTISRLLESNNSSAENAGSFFQIQDMESARHAQSKVPSPTLSVASKGEPLPPPQKNNELEIKDAAIGANGASNAPQGPQQPSEKGRTTKATDISEATHESMTVKETTSQGSAALVEQEVQQKPSASELGKKKKKKKVRLPLNGADLQWRNPQDVAAESYGMMPFGPSACNPYWGSMQLGMDGFMNPYTGAMPYMGYVPGPFDVPFGGILPQDPFGGYMMPVVPPQRDLLEFAMGSNQAPPVMSREEFEARKADLRRKREIERGGERDFPKDRESGRDVIGNGDVSSMKSKHKLTSQPESSDRRHYHHHRIERSLSPDRSHYQHQHHREERPSSPVRSHHHHRHRSETAPSLDHPPRDFEPSRPAKRRSDHDGELVRKRRAAVEPEDETATTTKVSEDAAERIKRHKASVFSRISFPDDSSASKKRKVSSSSDHHHHISPDAIIRSSSSHRNDNVTKGIGSGSGSVAASRKNTIVMDNDSSDDERHFKRRPSRYEAAPEYEPERGRKHR